MEKSDKYELYVQPRLTGDLVLLRKETGLPVMISIANLEKREGGNTWEVKPFAEGWVELLPENVHYVEELPVKPLWKPQGEVVSLPMHE